MKRTIMPKIVAVAVAVAVVLMPQNLMDSVGEYLKTIPQKTAELLPLVSSEKLDASGDENTSESADTIEKAIHRYECIRGDVTWEEAVEAAQSQNGYLAEITSAEEWELAVQAISQQENLIYVWLGASAPQDNAPMSWNINADQEPQPEELDFAWHENERSFFDGEIPENYLCTMIYSGEQTWSWNDVPMDIIKIVSSAQGKIGYLVEYDE